MEHQIIQDRTFDEERALYGSTYLDIRNCRFAGPADGESFLKECSDISVKNPYDGFVDAPSIGKLIMDDPRAVEAACDVRVRAIA